MQLYKFVANDYLILNGLRYNYKLFGEKNLSFNVKNIIIVNSDKDVIYNIKSKNFPNLSKIYGLNFTSKLDFYDYDYIFNEFYSKNKIDKNFVKNYFYDNTFNEFTYYTDYEKFYKYYNNTDFIKLINKKKLYHLNTLISNIGDNYNSIDKLKLLSNI